MGVWGGTVIAFTAFVSFIMGHWDIGAGCVCNIKNYNGGTVQARTKGTTQYAKLMQWTYQLRRGYMSALTKDCVSSDMSGKKNIFLLLFTVTALLCSALS